MTTATLEPAAELDADTPVVVRPRTVADLVSDLGDISPERIRMHPPIGTATEEDVLLPENKFCELIDGTLVEKAMGASESSLGMYVGFLIQSFVLPRNLGMVFGEQGTLKLAGKLVRMADVAFIPWDRLPDRKRPTRPIPEIPPDLAVEVLSASNTPKEMARKRREYFAAGTRLVWMVDPVARTVAVYTSETEFRTLTEADALDGGVVLPGFEVVVKDVFAELDRHG